MKTTEVNDSIIGKRCKCVFTGLMVTGTIEDIKIEEHTAEVNVRYVNRTNGETCNTKTVGHLVGRMMSSDRSAIWKS